MELKDKHVVVTGAGSGIGRALVTAFAAEGARAVVVADVNAENSEAVAAEIGGTAATVDVGRADEIQRLVETETDRSGPIDLFFSNAGVPGPGGGLEDASDADWQRTWEINTMAHVWAARAVLPGMLERGEGYIASTASAAGLLAQVGAMAYTVTKHAAVAVAEWLSITYGEAGIRVSCLCPQGVRTPMLDVALKDPIGAAPLVAGGLLEPADVAQAVVEGIRQEQFLILPHPEVGDYLALKGTQPERWLRGMRRLVRQARAASEG
ncbi:MAG TPA: SDR family NAD(P)-dependent oxidoreductase [Solirubrobacteraceae bacterium]|jgi:NAD(P)-dependent dehydrogenase (short-subunit alcohol dehydrogenase family)